MYGFSGIILCGVALTKSPAKFDEKTCMNPYVDRFYNNVHGSSGAYAVQRCHGYALQPVRKTGFYK